MKLKIYHPDGTRVTSYTEPFGVSKPVWPGVMEPLRTLHGQDPRYGCILDLDTADQLYVKHSPKPGNRVEIVLKVRWSERIACHLASYPWRNREKYYAACIAADRELAQMAGLHPLIQGPDALDAEAPGSNSQNLHRPSKS